MPRRKTGQATTPLSKDDIVRIYNDLKAQAGGAPPLWRDFLKQSAVPSITLRRLFGASAYSKLQELAGDTPNRFDLQRTSLDEIMSAYANLASAVLKLQGRLPVGSEWEQQGLRPTLSGLGKIHKIKWSEFPNRFSEHCVSNTTLAAKYSDLLDFIGRNEENEPTDRLDRTARLVQRICTQIRKWSPALRRNSEEAYKSELSHHLRSENPELEVREERGQSQCDIAIGADIAIESKKSPDQGEYDRCFGQIARHLETYKSVIVVIFDVPRRDAFEDFNRLVDKHFSGRVTVIRNG